MSIINLQRHTKTFSSNNNKSNSNNNKYRNMVDDNNNNSLTSNRWSWLISISSNNSRKKSKLGMLKKYMIRKIMGMIMGMTMTRYPLMKSNGNYNRFSISVEIIMTIIMVTIIVRQYQNTKTTNKTT